MTEPPIPPELWDYYPAERRPAGPPLWLSNAGGLSGSDLWRVEAPAGPLMLRRWPAASPDHARLDQIHAWLHRLGALPYVAAPIAGRGGRTWLAVGGRNWELSPWMPGTADHGVPPTPAHLGAMFAALASVHRALATGPGPGPGLSPGLVARGAELARLIAGEFASLAAVLNRAGTDPNVPTARRWLALARAAAPGVVVPIVRAADRPIDLQPCLRDARPDHFLFGGDRLTGLVDFGAMGVDSIAADLARLLGEATGGDARTRRFALEAYAEARADGRPTAAEIDALEAFEAANAVLGGVRWVRWHFAERRRFADPAAAAGGLSRTLRRLEAWVGRAE